MTRRAPTRLLALCLAVALMPAALAAQTVEEEEVFEEEVSAPADPAPAPPPVARGRGEGEDRPAPSTDVARLRGGRAQVVVALPAARAAAGEAALAARGVRVLVRRPLAALGSVLLTVDPRGLGLAALEEASGGTVAVNALYRPAAPRLYAAAMIGDARPGGCRAPGARLAMIDGPVDTGHAALAGAAVATATTRLPHDRAASADHGTAVAALLVGEDAGGALSGFAAGAALLAVDAFARETGGAAADVDRIAGALDLVAARGAGVVNLSFAGPENAVLAQVIAAAAARGLTLVAASGNAGRAAPGWPAAAPEVVSVTAVDAAARPWPRANRGAEFAAPGVDVYVAGPGRGGYASGTSYAAPVVSALAARRGVSGAEVLRAALRAGVRDLAAPGRDPATGWGLVRGGC
ncbi:S8 family serine peptidase [Jannaschia sp. Os4]|uniref:S8 family serine peptidase n=1 Tax=Jannaschia sp. Os4 TaxID=2807617 RepID=UPI00193A8093|nr:S8 family serine peptidase [Jannaschia sp. Os4]MBM2576050.1 S8 family serine peptidase [Jannaschia sp. Os4]